MPPTDPESTPVESTTSKPNPDAPLSFVPHEPPSQPVTRILINRYGELDEHELVKLLDSIQDERSRARFRESIYISLFFWLAVAWLIFYGPRVLWHAPQLINPADVLKQREFTQLNAPILIHPAPRVVPKPVDPSTIKRLQAMTREAPVHAPSPEPVPTPPPINTPPVSQPVPPTPQPVPRVSNPAIPEAPMPQRSSQPNFSTPSNSLQDAIRESANSRGNTSGSGMVATPKGAAVGMGPVQILSDVQGVDFNDYIRRLVANTKRAWIPLLPEETEPPISKQGETFIVFTILPDGSLAPPPAMRLEASSHDVAIDKAAWGSLISQGQFPPLPTQFHGPGLTLRFHFMVNKGIGQ